jgi:tripartite-type tricarboxylate transporter receptor subunit TctC
MTMRRSFRTLTLAAAIAGGLALAGAADAAEKGAAFYNGKTLTWVVGSAPGGGHDFFARLLSRHFE